MGSTNVIKRIARSMLVVGALTLIPSAKSLETEGTTMIVSDLTPRLLSDSSSSSSSSVSATGSSNQHASNRYKSTSSSSSNTTSSNKYRSSYSGASYSQFSSAHSFQLCDDSVVRVTSLYATCDSPYTFYYGNGANRNSPVCNYGDKISLQVTFRVVDNIEDNENIFVTMAIYDDQENLLLSVEPVYLCEDFVGYACTGAGYYGFGTRLRLPYPYENVENDHFYPQIQMAFSTKADSGYNLGAMNVECKAWNRDGGGDGGYVEWNKEKLELSPTEAFLLTYGMLGATCTLMLFVACFVWVQAADHVDNRIMDDEYIMKKESLMA